MEDIINKHDALILVRNTCRDVMLECTHHYDEGIGDDIYDDMSAVEAVLKCNKRIGKALNELPPVISGGDEDTVSRQSAIDIVTPYDTNRAMRDALEDLPAQSENGTAKWITGDKWKKWSVSSTSYCCSNCGWAWARKDQLGFFTFCPNCKKKMEKGYNMTANDLISRQAAINAIDECYCGGEDSCGEPWIYKENAVEAIQMIEPIPSAQPQRTCVNCGRTVNNGGWYADGGTRCPIEEHYALPKDGYCHLWEKRNITDDDYPERRTDE